MSPQIPLRQLRLTLFYLPSEWRQGRLGNQIQSPAGSDMGHMTLYPQYPYMYTEEFGLSLTGWVDRITLGNPAAAVSSGHRQSKHMAHSLLLLSGWFYCEMVVVRSTKEYRTLHRGSNTVLWYHALISPFMKVKKKIPCLPLKAVELLGLELTSGISIHGWLGYVSALGKWETRLLSQCANAALWQKDFMCISWLEALCLCCTPKKFSILRAR